MKHRHSLTMTALGALGLGALLLPACGGRFQTIREVEDETAAGRSSTGGAGASQGGAAPSAGGAPSSAGAPNSGGGPSSAGAPSSGGSCNNVKCTIPDCPAGSVPVYAPGACCATCSTTCAPCPKIYCTAGTHAETLPGSCCPTCVVDSGIPCEKGRREYAVQREAILNKYRYGCSSASECVVIAPLNLCESGCSYAPVWYGVADSFESNLSNAADMYCASCMLMPQPPCTPPTTLQCIDGQCRL